MMKIKRICFMTAVLLVSGTALFGQTSVKTVNQVAGANYDSLVKKGKLVATSFEGDGKLSLLPQTRYAAEIKQNLVQKQNKDFYFTYEALYYIPKKITVQKASELARTISKLEGITYYSNTKKKDTVLYKKAFRIENENSKKPVADKNTGNADGQVQYCLLDDNSFGETRYKLVYRQSDTELLTSFKTTDDMSLGLIRAIDPGNLCISLLVQPCEDGIVVYLCADLDSKNMPGIKAKITESITARMDAISSWFISLI